jgi:hypothetical protein
MKINLNNYKNSLKAVELYLSSNKTMSISDKITVLAVSTHMPLIVCAYYVAKIEGFNKEIHDKINQLMSFYKYDEIIGVEELFNEGKDNQNG